MVSVDEREKRMAIMAIKENTPKAVETEILQLIEKGYKISDLKKSHYAKHIAQ